MKKPKLTNKHKEFEFITVAEMLNFAESYKGHVMFKDQHGQMWTLKKEVNETD